MTYPAHRNQIEQEFYRILTNFVLKSIFIITVSVVGTVPKFEGFAITYNVLNDHNFILNKKSVQWFSKYKFHAEFQLVTDNHHWLYNEKMIIVSVSWFS